MCGAKMVHAFAVSSVVRGYHEYKDVWRPLCSLQLLLSVAQFCLMGYLDLRDPASTPQDQMEVVKEIDIKHVLPGEFFLNNRSLSKV